MTQPDLMRYQFGDLDEGMAALLTAVNSAEDELDALRKSLAGILAQWEGSGDATYTEIKAIWDGAKAQFQAIGAEIGKTVGDVNALMQSTEADVVATLRSHSI